MGNVNEGHERDEATSSSSDSADDLSESLSSCSLDERFYDDRSRVDLIDETGDISILSDTLDVNDGLGEIVAESTRVEEAIALDFSQHCQIGGDIAAMIQEPGMTSLISNISLPISESIIPSSFNPLEEGSPFGEGDEVFHTPELSGESKEETGVAVANQFQILMSFNDSLAHISSPVGTKCVSRGQREVPHAEASALEHIDNVLPDTAPGGQSGEFECNSKQVSEGNSEVSAPRIDGDEGSAEQSSSELHMPSALSILDSILGNQDPLRSDHDGFNEVQTSAAIADAANEIIAKFGNADFFLASTIVSDSRLSARAAECDKCGHILHDARKSKAQLEQLEWPINDKTDDVQTLEEAPLLPTVGPAGGPTTEKLPNDIISEEGRPVDDAETHEGPLERPVSFSDALGEMDGNLSEKDLPLAAPSSDAATEPQESTQSVESCKNELECEPLLPLANVVSREECENDRNLDEEPVVPSQDFDTRLQENMESVTGTNGSELSPFQLISSGGDAFVEDSPAILTSTSPVYKTACNITAVESSADKAIDFPPEKTAALLPPYIVSESLLTEKNESNVEQNALREPPDVPSLSPAVTPATVTKSSTVRESAAKSKPCFPAKRDEQRVKAPEAPRHTPDRPNWAVAPAEPASASKPPAKSERRKPAARRGRKSGEVASKDGPPKSSTSSANRSPVATPTITLQLPAKSSDIRASVSKSSGTKDPETKILEAKASAAKPVDVKDSDAKKAPKPILRLPDIGTYEKPETKPAKVKPAVSFDFAPSLTAKPTTVEQSTPAKQAISSTGVDSSSSSRSEVIATALPSASQASASSKSASSVEATQARRGRSMSISAAQNSALPPNKRPASIVSSWRSGMALPVIPEGTTRLKQLEDGRKPLSAAQSSVATVDVSAKDKIAAILAESCQSKVFKFEAPKAQGNTSATASSAPCPGSITVPKVDVSFKPGKTHSPESPLAEGFQANEHPLLAWRHGVTQPSPPTVLHNSSRATATFRKAEDKDSKKDGAASNSKGKTKAAKATFKAKSPQPPQGPATVNVGYDDLFLHAQERGEPVKVNLPQKATPPAPLRYQTPPRTTRPAFFSDVSGPGPITPSPVPASTHQHNVVFQRLSAAFSANPSKPEHGATRDVYPQMFMPQRSEGISAQVQHSNRAEQPPQLRHYEFVPRNHTTSHPTGHPHVPASSIPIRSVDSATEHPGQRPIQVPPTSHQAFAANPSVTRQADSSFVDNMSNFDGRAQSRDFSLYQQQIYQQRQAEMMKQSQGLRHRASESSFAQSQVNVDHPFPESWNGSLRSRPVAHQDMPIYQTSRPSAPPTNFAARAHGVPSLAGQQRMGTNFNIPTDQFPPYN